MKTTNFKYLGKSGNSFSNYKFYATIDETTGFWIFKKTVTKEISRSYIGDWFYQDTGAYIQNNDVRKLERVFESQHKDELVNIEV